VLRVVPAHVHSEGQPSNVFGLCSCADAYECVLCLRLAALQVPHDRPVVSQRMIETWIESAEQGLDEFDAQACRRRQQAAAQPGLSVS
jgi:hypothetical protein